MIDDNLGDNLDMDWQPFADSSDWQEVCNPDASDIDDDIPTLSIATSDSPDSLDLPYDFLGTNLPNLHIDIHPPPLISPKKLFYPHTIHHHLIFNSEEEEGVEMSIRHSRRKKKMHTRGKSDPLKMLRNLFRPLDTEGIRLPSELVRENTKTKFGESKSMQKRSYHRNKYTEKIESARVSDFY